MLANTYALTARGNGNYAQRLYEAFAYGRIPVYIDSGGKMPWDDVVSYDRDCFIHCRDINNLESDILNFHETHDIHRCQDECRKIYEDYLTFDRQIEIFEENVESFRKYNNLYI
jgi:hypothetical protein